MTKLKRNSNKARSRKRKIKGRVQDLRSRNKRNKPSLPWYSTATESERLSQRINAEAFIIASGKDLELSPEAINEMKVLFRYDLLFDMNTCQKKA